MTDQTNISADAYQELENQRDALAYRLARIESVNEEMVPGALVDRLMAAESPLLVWREHRNLSRDALASAADVAATEIERVERDGVDLGLRKMAALARALNIDAEELLPWFDEAKAAE